MKWRSRRTSSYVNDRREMATCLNTLGDFAQAYAIAHEIGHHIQNIMGTTTKMQRISGKISQQQYNQLSVKLELKVDFFAVIWAHHSQNIDLILEHGDKEDLLNTTFTIGDNCLQNQASGIVVSDSFTHGKSAQRIRWFKKGFDIGVISQGNTFSATSL